MDEQVCGFLIATNLAESNSSRAVTMGLLDATPLSVSFTGSLGCQLLAWGLAAGAFACRLFSACHLGDGMKLRWWWDCCYSVASVTCMVAGSGKGGEKEGREGESGGPPSENYIGISMILLV